MAWFRVFALSALLVSLISVPRPAAANEAKDASVDQVVTPAAASPPGLGEPGKLESITIDSGRPADVQAILVGNDAREQLVVTGNFDSGQTRDLTDAVTFELTPAGIVQVDETGLVTPLADGEVTVTARSSEGPAGSIKLAVTHFHDAVPINFANQIVPVFTKLGCNSGGCHGKASGQNGFKLSLLGFEPAEDFEYLVKEGRGRRLFPASPDRSLLLLKGTNAMPHGGGQRLPADSHEYRLLRRWIAQGMPYGSEKDPVVTRLSVFPEERTMPLEGRQQVTAIAHYSDGSTEDVTRMVQFEPNNPELAESTSTGLVNTLGLTGDVAIMARYQGHVAVFRASVPLGIKVENVPQAKGVIDELVFNKLETLGIPPSPVCDDATFIRRVTIDVAGRLPTPDETAAFVADTDPAKRDKWIDTLLAGPDYADYFANKWSSVLRNKRRTPNHVRGTFAFHSWIRQSLYTNKPYDEFAREIIAASGEVGSHPPVAWYREVKDANQQVEDTAQLFLGLRIQCARCHHHPFEKWSQDDYYSFAAFFSRVKQKGGKLAEEPRIFHAAGQAVAKNPKTGQNRQPAGLGAPALDVPAEEDPRQALVDWMADAENPFFAPALVNRYWKHFFDRGLVDPEDDMRVTNPASNPQLLGALSKDFIDSGFDLKHLVRTICTSQTYQLSSEPNEYNLTDKQNYSRYYPKRLTAEVLLDALNQVTHSRTDFGGLPADTRAVQLPDQEGGGYFLSVFGRPQADTACECERSQEANLAQSLHLLNSAEVQGKLTAGDGRAATLAADSGRSHEEKIRELYRWVYSREPLPDEAQVALGHIEKLENKQQAYEDVLWALVNTKEFLFNH
ncbi:MAG: DUF1549 domain-containing protein [Pirellulales bacterium]|nr:DUF1549 domain-containing protein [Pirellulales bacterium]